MMAGLHISQVQVTFIGVNLYQPKATPERQVMKTLNNIDVGLDAHQGHDRSGDCSQRGKRGAVRWLFTLARPARLWETRCDSDIQPARENLAKHLSLTPNTRRSPDAHDAPLD
jgi:hypothetical protein